VGISSFDVKNAFSSIGNIDLGITSLKDFNLVPRSLVSSQACLCYHNHSQSPIGNAISNENLFGN